MDYIEDKSVLMSLNEWKEKGELISVFNKDIFTIDTGKHEKCLVILHGYATSSFDYKKVLPELSKHYRVILLDFIGFGLSEKLDKKYFTIIDQTDYVLELCNLLNLSNITFYAHDYGTTIAQEIIARKNSNLTDIDIDKFIFSNGSMPIEKELFLEYQKFLKDEVSKKIITSLASFGVYKKTICELFYDDAKITLDEIKEMWYLLEINNGRDVIHFVYNYIKEREIFWNRWVNGLKETNLPVKIIWGLNDPISKTNLAEALVLNITNCEVDWIDNCGHYPMIECPDEFINAVLR